MCSTYCTKPIAANASRALSRKAISGSICSLDSADLQLAASRRWRDFEDCLIDVCAEKVKADVLLTRDEVGFAQSKTRVLSPREFFAFIEDEYRIVYDEIELPSDIVAE